MGLWSPALWDLVLADFEFWLLGLGSMAFLVDRSVRVFIQGLEFVSVFGVSGTNRYKHYSKSLRL